MAIGLSFVRQASYPNVLPSLVHGLGTVKTMQPLCGKVGNPQMIQTKDENNRETAAAKSLLCKYLSYKIGTILFVLICDPRFLSSQVA